MALIYLTSKGFFNETVKNAAREWADGKTKEVKAAILTTASPKKAADPFAAKTKEDFFRMNVRQADFIDIEFEDPEVLLQYDILYICGGNPFHLLQMVKSSGAEAVFRELISRDVLFVGVSAGAMLFGPHIEIADVFTPAMNSGGLKDLTALGIYEKPLFPHYGREEKFEDASGRTIEQRISSFETAAGTEVERLRDSEVLTLTR